MLFKIKKLLFITMILLTGCVFYGCVEEPTIEPVKTPYAVLRIGNFTGNVPTMSVAIEGVSAPVELANKSLSGFFDIKPGNRQFTITAGGKVIFDKEIELSSYEEMSLLFFGDYSTVDTLSTFQNLRVDEGDVFTLDAPEQGKQTLTFVNLLTNDVTQFPPKLTPLLDITEGTNLLAVSIEPKQILTKEYEGTGNTSFDFSIYNAGNPIITANAPANLEANKRYLVVIAGNASAYSATAFASDPLPVRTK